ncbi:MAG: nuclear transport factor 2 family protein [Acidovorax sp.]
MKTATHLAALIDRYCEAWSEHDPRRKQELLNAVWSPGASYTDPTVHTVGESELLAHIAKVQAKRPGSKVIRTSEVDAHHGIARFAWRAIEANGNALPEGLDLAFLSEDGTRIERIIGFFGPVKPRDAME